jgi:DNA-binding NtrC family response regulator
MTPADDVTDFTPDRETVDDKLRGQRRDSVAVKSYLFVVLEGDHPLDGGARFALDDIDEILIGRGERRAASVEARDGVRRLTLHLKSPSLSRLQARLRRELAAWVVEDTHSRNGTYVNGARVTKAVMGPDDMLEVGRSFLTIRSFPQRPGESTSDLDSAELENQPAAFRTLLPPIAARFEALRIIARSSIGVLLCGETGTGKEVLARALHELSGRGGPFIAVNCSTLTDGLAESQLFGHVKGAFSGAIGDAVGFVRAAEKGTLLLDEVGDLTGPAQGALLRVLQEREVVPVGRARPQTIDVRFMATTPRQLAVAVERDQFRSDLFARLSGFVHTMTPLRERREDLGLLAAALLRKAGASEGDNLSILPETGLELLRHGWPLNVRELEQVLVRSRLLSQDGVMYTDLGGPPVRETSRPRPAGPLSAADRELHARISDALAAAKGNVSEAARALSKGRVPLHRLMRRLDIDPNRFRRQE